MARHRRVPVRWIGRGSPWPGLASRVRGKSRARRATGPRRGICVASTAWQGSSWSRACGNGWRDDLRPLGNPEERLVGWQLCLVTGHTPGMLGLPSLSSSFALGVAERFGLVRSDYRRGATIGSESIRKFVRLGCRERSGGSVPGVRGATGAPAGAGPDDRTGCATDLRCIPGQQVGASDRARVERRRDPVSQRCRPEP
jgi:hypothetical protein